MADNTWHKFESFTSISRDAGNGNTVANILRIDGNVVMSWPSTGPWPDDSFAPGLFGNDNGDTIDFDDIHRCHGWVDDSGPSCSEDLSLCPHWHGSYWPDAVSSPSPDNMPPRVRLDIANMANSSCSNCTDWNGSTIFDKRDDVDWPGSDYCVNEATWNSLKGLWTAVYEYVFPSGRPCGSSSGDGVYIVVSAGPTFNDPGGNLGLNVLCGDAWAAIDGLAKWRGEDQPIWCSEDGTADYAEFRGGFTGIGECDNSTMTMSITALWTEA